MKKSLYNKVVVVLAGASALSLSACRADFDFEEQKLGTPEQVYNESFKTQFGQIDPEHTWMPWTEKFVIAGEDGDYEVYENTKLIGLFEDVKAGDKMELSVEFGTKEVMVLRNGRGKMVQLGETVNMGSTRATKGNTTCVIETDNPTKSISFTAADATAWQTKLPESRYNLGEVTQNFEFVSTGSGTCYVYPLYWNFGNANLNLGVYYYDAEGNKVETGWFFNPTECAQLFGVKSDGSETLIQHQKNGAGNESRDNTKYTSYRTTGISITLPVGTVFGFYWDAIASQTGDSHNTIYSNKDYNNGTGSNTCVGRTYSLTPHNGGSKRNYSIPLDHCHGGVFDYTLSSGTYKLFTVDDCDNDFDLNDLVMIIDPAPYVVDKDKQQFSMAFEDMGSIGDFDFNDVVLTVEHVAGQKTGTVTLQAAGGTLPIEIYYKDQKVLFNEKSEVHEVFGVAQNVMVNTGIGDNKTPKTSGVMTFSDVAITPENVAKNFTLHVTSESGTEYTTIGLPDRVTGGEAPQGFVVNSKTWSWPQERQPITDKHPNFINWVQNHLNIYWWDAATDGSFTNGQ